MRPVSHLSPTTLTISLFATIVIMASPLRALSTTVTTKKPRPLHVHLFRQQDLRLHDSPALAKAISDARAASSSGILPIFCFDPRIYGNGATSSFGSLKCGPRRAKFALECVADLRSNLEKSGSGLVVALGRPEDVLRNLLHAIDGGERKRLVPKIYCQQEVASEEIMVEKAVRQVARSHRPQLGSLEAVWGSTLYDPEELPFNDGVYGMPDTFTPFRNKVEKKLEIGQPLPTPSAAELALVKEEAILEVIRGETIPGCSLSYFPTLEDLGYTPEQARDAKTDDPRGVMAFRGGETAALVRVKDYIWDKDRLKIYFDTRNGMIGADYSTKFSPWLAHGCLSPRYIARECRRYESLRVANKSTYWVVFELLWRDFFKFFSQKHGSSIFSLDGILGKDARGSHPNSRRWGLDRRTVAAWKEGRTGYPLVDANMRELAATGFQSNRGRQNVCSFLALDTNTDWRYGADYFETELLDYDPYSNWGNWCSGAGMTGGRVNRFNIVKQSKDYDCDGDYVRLWLPELNDVPTEFVHEPWKMTKDQQEEFGVRLGVDYPRPIIVPFVPRRRDGGNRGGDRGGRGGKNGRNGGSGNNGGNKNANRSKGQRRDMKSLKEGSYKFK